MHLNFVSGQNEAHIPKNLYIAACKSNPTQGVC